ncbi:MAG: Nucleotidyl transferase AbiEii toxin, Type system [Mycobacterium sp.]|nr:Nucleotidyl transferase AbiEii toxin, Type system [Mycobacterium sp.]
MKDNETPRSAAARRAAELALVRVVHHYGGRPEFVLLGGLVPALLCANSAWRHAGTTDVDVQVNLEIAGGRSTPNASKRPCATPNSCRTTRMSGGGT